MNLLDLEKIKQSLKKAIILLSILFLIFAFDWVIERLTLESLILRKYFSIESISLKEYFAIEPRTFQGLLGIFFSFFLHADLNHLINNSFILLVGLTILFNFYDKFAYSNLFAIIFLSQIFIWTFGQEGKHLGASGVAFGLISFISSVALFIRSQEQLILSFFVIFLFGRAISSGMFPEIQVGEEVDLVKNLAKNSISYAGHWGGVFAGIGVCYYAYRKKRIK